MRDGACMHALYHVREMNARWGRNSPCDSGPKLNPHETHMCYKGETTAKFFCKECLVFEVS